MLTNDKNFNNELIRMIDDYASKQYNVDMSKIKYSVEFKSKTKAQLKIGIDDAKSDNFYVLFGDEFEKVKGNVFNFFGHRLGYFKNEEYYDLIDLDSGTSLLRDGMNLSTKKDIVNNIYERQDILYKVLEDNRRESSRVRIQPYWTNTLSDLVIKLRTVGIRTQPYWTNTLYHLVYHNTLNNIVRIQPYWNNK